MNLMLEGRTFEEELVDKLLLLYLIEKANCNGLAEGITKITKLSFLSEHTMILKKNKGFNYNYFRYEQGPYSKELADDFKKLLKEEMIAQRDHYTFLTPRGKEILDGSSELLEINQSFADEIDEVCKKYAPHTLTSIKKDVYGLVLGIEGPYKNFKIKNIPQCADILVKLDVRNAVKEFKLSIDWCETLELLMDNDSMISFEKSMEDTKKGRIYSYEQLARGI